MSSGKWKKYRSCPITRDGVRVLYGTLLGDGSLFKDPECVNYRFSVTHSNRHSDYIQWKQSILGLPSSIWNDEKRNLVKLQSLACTELTSIHTSFYNGAVKRIPRDIDLTELLSPLSIATWFMDDGSYDVEEAVVISAYAFCEEDMLRVAKYMDHVYGIKINVWSDNRVYIRKESHDRFFSIITHYVSEVPSMHYKVRTWIKPGVSQVKLLGYDEPCRDYPTAVGSWDGFIRP